MMAGTGACTARRLDHALTAPLAGPLDREPRRAEIAELVPAVASMYQPCASSGAADGKFG